MESVGKPQLSLNLSAGLQEGDDEYIDSWALSKPDVAVALAEKLGAEIISEFPNSRMAEEVKSKLDILTQRAQQQAGV